MEKCMVKQGIRIKLEEDRRIFTPADRTSYKWKNLYNKRTSVERVNSRFDGFFGLEKHFIRGKLKMTIKCGLSLCVMLATTVGRIKRNEITKAWKLTG